MPALLRKPFAEAAPLIRDADLLLFRRRPFSWRSPSTYISKLIATSGRSDFTHAALAAWWRSNAPTILLCVEVREFVGGRAVTLESQVRANPGLIDVYSPEVECRTDFVVGTDGVAQRVQRYSRMGAVAAMLSLTGQPYGYRSIARAACAYLPVLRLAFQTDTDDTSTDGRAVFCSQAVSWADRLAGVDPVPNLADRDTEPGDLARSEFYRYQFTLEP